MICPSCRNETSDTAKFCRNCGEPIVRERPAPPGPSPEPAVSEGSVCRGCGVSLRPNLKFCAGCGTQVVQERTAVVAEYFSDHISGNTSGQGASAILPRGVGGWNWGAFCFNWIWAIANNTWIGLLALIPYVGIVMAIMLGVRGNEWAWQNRRWESVEQFRDTQAIWNRWFVVFLIIGLALFISGVVFWIIAFTKDPNLLSEMERGR